MDPVAAFDQLGAELENADTVGRANMAVLLYQGILDKDNIDESTKLHCGIAAVLSRQQVIIEKLDRLLGDDNTRD